MAAAIKAETNGRFDIQIFPNNQLGSDTDMLSQMRSGGVEFFTLSGLILSTLVPAASINGIGFAFPDYDTVWKAMDGELGAYVRGEIAKAGLVVMDKIWDNGFRQTTSSTKPINGPDDLKGFKIRVPVSPLWTSMFKAFDAAPASINFSEVYSALQTKIVEGQENPLAIISTAKLYEVQKYCSLTNHMWDGFWFLANRRAWEKLPEDVRTIVAKNINAAARQGARRRRQAERRSAAGTGRQGPDLQPARRGAVPRQAALRRLLCRVEGQIRRRGLGAAGKVRRQAVVTASSSAAGGRHGSCRTERDRGRRGGCSPLAAVRCWHRSKHSLGSLVEIPAALLVVAEIVILFAGVVARYGLHRPLIWSDELASILFLWLAMLGAVVAFRRAEHMRMTAVVANAQAGDARLSRSGRDLRGAGVPAADRLAGLRIRLRGKLHHHAGAADLQHLARRGAAGRHRPDGAVCAAAAGARRRCPHRAGARSLSVALVIAVFWLAQPSLRPLGNLNLIIFFVGVAGFCVFAGVPIAFGFGLATFGYLALTTQHAADGAGRPHGRGHEPPHPAVGAAVRVPRAC